MNNKKPEWNPSKLAKMKSKRNNLPLGIDPEDMIDAITIAGFYIEGGARKFKDFSNMMIDNVGEWIKPYLKGLYENIRRYPGMQTIAREMDSTEYVDQFDIETFEYEKETRTYIGVDKAQTKGSGNDILTSTDKPIMSMDPNKPTIVTKEPHEHDLALVRLQWLRDNNPDFLMEFYREGKLKEHLTRIVSWALIEGMDMRERGVAEQYIQEVRLDMVAPAENLDIDREVAEIPYKLFSKIVKETTGIEI